MSAAPRALAPRAVLFDLDGTLLDTAPDFYLALNALRAEAGLPPLDHALIRPHVSHGSPAMLRLAFDIDATHASYETHRARFLELYASVLASATVPFPGVPALLDALAARGLPWGIVTNKPGWLTTPLLARLALDARAACVISGDSTARAKPFPDPLLAAAAALGVPPTACVYVGDAERDVVAARAAGMPVLVARYGYLDPLEQPDAWQADGGIDAALELLAWI
ncbi:MAG: phosphoglycolate phosphatase [Gammaproteobacteria bacterium]